MRKGDVLLKSLKLLLASLGLILIIGCGDDGKEKIIYGGKCPEQPLANLIELEVTLKQRIPEGLKIYYWEQPVYDDCETVDAPINYIAEVRKTGEKRLNLRALFHPEIVLPESFDFSIVVKGGCNKGAGEIAVMKMSHPLNYKTERPFAASCKAQHQVSRGNDNKITQP